MSTEGKALQFSVLPYRCSICPPLMSVLVVAQPSSEVPEGLMNYPVCVCICIYQCCKRRYFCVQPEDGSEEAETYLKSVN